MTRAALLREGAAVLEAAGVEGAARDARLLMRWASGLEAAALTVALSEGPGAEEAARWQSALARRAAREPLSHITGTREFWGRTFHVGPQVLDPRPETETLVADVIHRGPFRRVLDLGTGSGCILASLLAEWPGASGVGTDFSADALAVAERNAAALGVSDRITFRHGSWWEAVKGSFDLIVSNPPYIAAEEMAALSPEVREHEPHLALTLGGDGLDAYRAIARGVRDHLAPGGMIMLEVGPTQSHDVGQLLAAAGLVVKSIVPDLDQRARVVVAQL